MQLIGSCSLRPPSRSMFDRTDSNATLLWKKDNNAFIAQITGLERDGLRIEAKVEVKLVNEMPYFLCSACQRPDWQAIKMVQTKIEVGSQWSDYVRRRQRKTVQGPPHVSAWNRE